MLDSIVKNVGTPYTLYFGRNLFKTFMESYAVVAQPIRRKMEEMLRTWKEPVPGSMDSRPVFQPELVRPIENALMKARAASMPAQGPIPGRGRVGMPQRDTPTPPGMRPQGAPQGYPTQYPPPNGTAPFPGQQVSSSTARMRIRPNSMLQTSFYPPHSAAQPTNPAAAPFQAPFPGAYGVPVSTGISIETLKSDIQNLIVATRAEVSHNSHDVSVQNRLRALVDLQGILQSTSLPPDQLELIKNKVTDLAASVNMRATSNPTPTSLPTSVPPPAQPAFPVAVGPPQAPAAPAQGSVTLDSLLGPGALATLLGRQQAAAPAQHSAPTTTAPFVNVAIRSPPPKHTELPKPAPAPAAPAAPNQNPLGLLDQLRAAGLLPAAAPPTPVAAPIAPVPAPASILPPNIASILAATKAAAARNDGPIGGISSLSLKQP